MLLCSVSRSEGPWSIPTVHCEIHCINNNFDIFSDGMSMMSTKIDEIDVKVKVSFKMEVCIQFNSDFKMAENAQNCPIGQR